MINVGDSNISVYIGDTELTVYAGDVQIYPMNLGTLTGITLDNLTWVTDVSYEGGTATSANCSYKVTGHYDSGKSRTLTSKSTITGSLVVPATTAETREMVGTLTLTATCSGFTATGSVDVYQEAYVIDYSTHYLTFKIQETGNLKWFTSGNSAYNKTIQYSRDNGATWTSVTSTSANNGTSISVTSGETILFKGSNSTYGSSGNKFASFYRSVKYEVEGNIMSLIYGDDFTGKTALSSSYTFLYLFRGTSTTGPTNAENLVLPATTLKTYCYQRMFYEAFLLVKPPKILPATTLQSYCYNDMFAGCRVLTTAPELPAPTLVSNCYSGMMRVCPKLNYVKCLATSGITSTALNVWLQQVASTGTFVKKSGVTWPSGTSGIPSGWTVEEV